MQITVTGKGMDVGDSLRGHVGDQLPKIVDKYFANSIEGHVVFTREGQGFRADCSVHVGAGMTLQSRGQAEEALASFDNALDRLEKQLRRYKRRIRDHHRTPRPDKELVTAQSYVLAPEDDNAAEDPEGGPLIVAEATTNLPTVTVGEAVMRMDLADAPVQMFHNSAHGGLNVVYRRADGNIGWIDPVATSSEDGSVDGNR
jgi:ribosomal subunit interface protein